MRIHAMRLRCWRADKYRWADTAHELNLESGQRSRDEIRLFFWGGQSGRNGDMRDLLGGKGAGLAEMTRIGLPVPAGFTITTEACDYYFKHGKKYPERTRGEVQKNIAQLEKVTGKKLVTRRIPAGERSLRVGAIHAGDDGDNSQPGPERKSVEGLAEATETSDLPRTPTVASCRCIRAW